MKTFKVIVEGDGGRKWGTSFAITDNATMITKGGVAVTDKEWAARAVKSLLSKMEAEIEKGDLS